MRICVEMGEKFINKPYGVCYCKIGHVHYIIDGDDSDKWKCIDNVEVIEEEEMIEFRKIFAGFEPRFVRVEFFCNGLIRKRLYLCSFCKGIHSIVGIKVCFDLW